MTNTATTMEPTTDHDVHRNTFRYCVQEIRLRHEYKRLLHENEQLRRRHEELVIERNRLSDERNKRLY